MMNTRSSPAERFDFGPSFRLKKRAEFDTVFQRGGRFRGRWVTIVATPNGLDRSRLGVIASRRVGGATKRNRAKRLVREAFRRNRHLLAAPVDLVVIASRALGEGRKLDDLDPEIRRLFGKINETVAAG